MCGCGGVGGGGRLEIVMNKKKKVSIFVSSAMLPAFARRCVHTLTHTVCENVCVCILSLLCVPHTCVSSTRMTSIPGVVRPEVFFFFINATAAEFEMKSVYTDFKKKKNVFIYQKDIESLSMKTLWKFVYIIVVE